MSKSQETFGQRLAAARKRRGMTQAAAADAAGISQNYWSDLETDKKDPPFSMLRRVAAAVGMKAWQILKPE